MQAQLSNPNQQNHDRPLAIPLPPVPNLRSALPEIFKAEVGGVALEPKLLAAYQGQAKRLLQAGGQKLDRDQFVVFVDRSPLAQNFVLFLYDAKTAQFQFVGASKVSTGSSKRNHFLTPVGVFENSLVHFSFRAQGTPNKSGVRGYGAKGSRVWDFGIVQTRAGWANPNYSQPIHFLMHATDPKRLEPRLGQQDSKGCVRISAALNSFLDRHAVLDQAYEAQAAKPSVRAILRTDRTTTPFSGRYLIVGDSQAEYPERLVLPAAK